MRRFVWLFVLPLLFAASCADQAENPAEPGVSDTSALLSRAGVIGDEVIVLPPDGEAVYDPPGERIKVYTDFDLFDGATGELTEIGFDDLPWPGSSCPSPLGYEDTPANPLTVDGVTFSDPDCLWSDYCSDPSCPGGKVVLVVHTQTTVDLPPTTGGVLLSVEGTGDDWFSVAAEDHEGSVVNAWARGVPYDTRYLGFTSTVGISRLIVTGHETWELPVAAVWLEILPEESRPAAERE